jgi:hypothetical protein
MSTIAERIAPLSQRRDGSHFTQKFMQIGLTSHAAPQSSCNNAKSGNLRDDTMNSLKEKLREADPSNLSDPLTDDTVSLSNYLDRTGAGTEAHFGSRRTIATLVRDEPLPSMFRETASESDPVNATATWSPYIAAAVFLSLVGAAAVHFTAATPSTDKGAVKPITKADVDKAATPDRGATATAAFFSAPPAVDKAAWQTQAVAITPSSAAEPEAWSDTVDTFKKLLAEQKASQAPGLQQSEAERVLGQLEAWSKAKTR